MMEDVRAGKVDCIIVKDLSRFGRDYIEAGRLIQKDLPALNVRFIPASNEPSGRACTASWRMPRGSNTPLLAAGYLKVKAYLRKGARALRGENEYPNERVGYGRLNMVGTFEALIGV